MDYADYSAWQRSRLTSGQLAGSIAYWKEKLHGVPVLELPTDRPYPQGGLSSSGNSAFVEVPSETAAALRRLTLACNTTLYTTVLTAWKVGRDVRLGAVYQYDCNAHLGMWQLPTIALQLLSLWRECAGSAEPLHQAKRHCRRLSHVRPRMQKLKETHMCVFQPHITEQLSLWYSAGRTGPHLS